MLEEAESLLVDRSDLDMLCQVLIEHGLFTEKEWRNMVSICLMVCFAYNYGIACNSIELSPIL